MPDRRETLAEIVHRIDGLEDRLCALEHGTSSQTIRNSPAPASADSAMALPAWPDRSGSIFPVLGIAMLGLAGAYLLRAVAESGTLPNVAAVALATAYAGGWLFAAAKLHAADAFSRTIYACASALTLAPMLWESTTRFHYLSAPGAAAILGVFTLASYLLAWTARLRSVIWISTLTTAVTAIILAGATRDLPAFACVLLVMALLNEIAASFGRWSTTSFLPAAAADIVVSAMIFIYSRPAESRVEYDDLSQVFLLAPASLLFLIYGVSGIFRAVLQRHSMTLPEIAQLAVSGVLVLEAVVHFATPGQTTAFAVACIALSLASYAAMFGFFDPTADRRNYLVCTGFSLVLLLVGCALSLDNNWLASCFGALAMGTAVIEIGKSRRSLRFHSLVYLVAAAFASHAVEYAAHALAGTFPPQPPGIVWMILGTAVFCYAAGSRPLGEERTDRGVEIASATLAIAAVSAMAVSATLWATGLVTAPAESHIAVLRTFSVCAVAIASAFLGARLPRLELIWLSYALLALLAAKLLVEDLRHESAEFIAISIFLYALTLIGVPRLARRKPIDANAVAEGVQQIAVSTAQHD